MARRVLVTGGGSGIGLAAVRSLIAGGARVAVADISTDAVPESENVVAFQCDVADERSVEAAMSGAVEWLGGLDAVIHSAGIMREQGQDIREISLESWNRLLQVNLTGSFLVARESVRHMGSSGGVLILVGSGAGTTGPSGSIPYGASKGGVNGLAMTLESHLAPHNIRVHNFMPGSVNTPLVNASLDEAIRNGKDPVQIEASRQKAVGVASLGPVLAFLASEDADVLRGNLATR